MESEKKQRQHKKAMLDDNLESELIPLEHTEKRGKKQVTIIKETPCAYVDNLPQKIISFAEENLKNDFMTSHGDKIPEDKLYVKVGGDHGKGSMKFAFQLANLKKPNSSKKTVVFTLFEAKDTRNNLRTVTQRYKEQLAELEKLKWQ